MIMNSSYCDDGNSSSIDFFLEGGVGLTVQFLKLNDSVKMMPSISFVPGIIFNATSDTSKYSKYMYTHWMLNHPFTANAQMDMKMFFKYS